MQKLKILFQNNRDWVQSKISKDATYFSRMAEAQAPNYLWIGCSDSRVPANEIVGLEAGELFVHRNVANVFPNTDFNCLSVLEYAVDLLKIQHVIVCGHYGCGGVKAAMESHQLGLVDNWLRNIRDVYARFKDELDNIPDQNDRFNRLVELNVMQQVLNVCHTSIVQGAWMRNQLLWVHGWVYDLANGTLKDLNCCISSIDQVEGIYRIYVAGQSPTHTQTT
ncbi:MAG: carbonate dehydratase [Parachlamydiaceae bacterium]|nr:carbonate dehydratase [Parachlamydiaceae bacterium]